MTSCRYLTFTALLAVLAGARVAAAQTGAATPDAAARSFFAAMEEARWAEAARMVHPAALARFRDQKLMMLRSASDPATERGPTVDELLRHDPRMPRAVAEYQVQQSRQNTRTFLSYELASAGVASAEEFERLGPEEAFARFLAANDERRQVQRALEGQADSAVAVLFSRMAPRTVRRVIGSVPHGGPGAETAYAVYSLSSRGGSLPIGGPDRVAVLALRRDGRAWKVEPGDPMGLELFGGGSFAVMFTGQDSMPDLAALAARPAVWPETGPPQLRVRLEGVGADPLKQPPKLLIVERLAANGTVAARVEIPAEAWPALRGMFEMFMLLLPEREQEHEREP